MGVETLILAATAATSAVSTIQQRQQAKRVAEAQREGNKVQAASEENQNRLARRRAAREERIRRARVAQAASNQGISGGSAEEGTKAGLTINAGQEIASQSSQSLAARGISAANQRAADASFKQDQIAAFGNIIQGGLGLAYTARTGQKL